jgi:hypothetical protein
MWWLVLGEEGFAVLVVDKLVHSSILVNESTDI